jgi:hypothetical protein
MMPIVGCTYGFLNKLKNKVPLQVLIIMEKNVLCNFCVNVLLKKNFMWVINHMEKRCKKFMG